MPSLSDITQLYSVVRAIADRAIAGGTPTTTREMVSSYADTEDVLQPGQRKMQIRVQASIEDRQSDSTTTILGADIEITVVRSLHLEENPNDERLYRSEEMLFGMQNLLQRQRWLDEGSAFIKGIPEGGDPEITEDPSRTGNTVSYTVALSVTLPQPT